MMAACGFAPRSGVGRWRRALAALCLSGWSLALFAVEMPPPEQEAAQAFEQALRAMDEGDWGLAELLLERSLMFQPDQAQVRMELALLLARRGRPAAARALLQSLLDDPRTPPEHRERLQALLRDAVTGGDVPDRDGRSVAPSSQTWLETSLGWSRNPWARPGIGELALTLPDGDFVLPVLRQDHPGASAGMVLRHQAAAGWGFETQLQRVDAGGDGGTAARVALFGAFAPAGLPLEWGGSSARALDGSTRQTATLAWLGQAGRLSASLFTEPQLQRRGWQLRADQAWQPRPDMRAAAFAEWEHAMRGMPSHVRAGLQGAWALGSRWLFQAQGQVQQDLQGYSALLNHGERRQVQTAQLVLERGLAQDGPWHYVLRLHAAKRWSNLPLFTWRDVGVQLALQRRWPVP